jgi:hypothetical protein
VGPGRRVTRSLPSLLVAATVLAAGACHSTTAPGTPLALQARATAVTAVPVLGTDSTLEVGSWNLEWFGDPGNGPDDEDRQLENIRTVIDGLDMDLWSVQEVVDEDHFTRLLDALPAYDGFLANDPFVADGPAYYNDFGGNELKVGLLYRPSVVTIDSARVILTENDHHFAGRPPVKVHLSVHERADPVELVVVLLHAKAGARSDDRDRRETGANALKAYLDTRYPDRRVMVVGDFNDDVDTSITRGEPSPYRSFIDDAASYLFPTAELSAAGVTSTVFYSDVIDHHLVTDELAADYVPGSAHAFPGELYLDDYGETTTDHYPILVRYAPWTAGGPPMDGTLGPHGRVTLTWSGATTPTVDIYRDDVLIIRTDDDGDYSDALPITGTRSVTYRVCDAGSPRCSEQVSVIFGS